MDRKGEHGGREGESYTSSRGYMLAVDVGCGVGLC